MKRIDEWLREHVPWSPNFALSMAVLTSVLILAGAEPITGLTILAACLYFAFR